MRFEDVSFGYEAGRPVLQHLDLEIGAGQTVAVVGGSGSGKSTLGRLLLRLYDVDGGRITIDGQDIRGVRAASLRQAIGVVPQETQLFDDTFASNIGDGRLGVGLAQPAVASAQRECAVHATACGRAPGRAMPSGAGWPAFRETAKGRSRCPPPPRPPSANSPPASSGA